MAAPVSSVYAVCADVDAYPTWWREVRSVERLDEQSGLVSVRSLLPYTLRLRLISEVEDPSAGWLRVRIDGDLAGWSEFELTPEVGDATTVTYRQEVEMAAPMLRRVGAVLGPLLRANHTVMMRSCRRGMAQTVTSHRP